MVSLQLQTYFLLSPTKDWTSGRNAQQGGEKKNEPTAACLKNQHQLPLLLKLPSLSWEQRSSSGHHSTSFTCWGFIAQQCLNKEGYFLKPEYFRRDFVQTRPAQRIKRSSVQVEGREFLQRWSGESVTAQWLPSLLDPTGNAKTNKSLHKISFPEPKHGNALSYDTLDENGALICTFPPTATKTSPSLKPRCEICILVQNRYHRPACCSVFPTPLYTSFHHWQLQLECQEKHSSWTHRDDIRDTESKMH